MIAPAPETLTELGVQPVDAAEILTAWPGRGEWAAIERHADAIAATFGDRDRTPDIERPPDATSRYYHAYLCLQLLPRIKAYHRVLGVGEAVSAATLRVLGTNVARHRRIYGHGGVDGAPWVLLVFRGLVYHLGRLVFERAYVGAEIAEATGVPPGNSAIGVHIPPTGALRPDACDEAFSLAARAFARWFPDERAELAHCRSWILDPGIADYLPTSNIVAFGSRFTLLDAEDTDDESIVAWVFETARPKALAELRPVTALERAIVDRLARGGHWRLPLGWLWLPAE